MKDNQLKPVITPTTAIALGEQVDQAGTVAAVKSFLSLLDVHTDPMVRGAAQVLGELCIQPWVAEQVAKIEEEFKPNQDEEHFLTLPKLEEQSRRALGGDFPALPIVGSFQRRTGDDGTPYWVLLKTKDVPMTLDGAEVPLQDRYNPKQEFQVMHGAEVRVGHVVVKVLLSEITGSDAPEGHE